MEIVRKRNNAKIDSTESIHCKPSGNIDGELWNVATKNTMNEELIIIENIKYFFVFINILS